MQPEVRTRLHHVIEAGEKILRITVGKTFLDYTTTEALPPAVERLFTIIGEALREANRLDPTIGTRITEFRRIIDFRNILVHDYAIVYDEGVWRIIQGDLPRLLTEVRTLLSGAD
ncbi:MAG TPA: HepT-like ribonuclease domain-containing protein [Thermoanaerobaculia bacterium]